MLNTTPTYIADSLRERCRTLEAALNELSIDASQFHSGVHIQDANSRNLFQALSRILAVSDQMQMVLTLINEDVRAIEATGVDPMTAFWMDQIDGSFEEWASTMPFMSSIVH